MGLSTDPLLLAAALAPIAAALSLFAARRLGGRIRAAEVALWIGWVALAIHHTRLAVAGSDLVTMAAGAVLAAGRTLSLLPALARSKGRTTGALFAAGFAFLLVLWPWSRAGRAPDGDEPYYLLLTESLAWDFDVDLADEYRDRSWESFSPVPIEPQPGDPVGPHGERWSRHPALLSLALAPLYRFGGIPAAELGMVALAAALAAAIHSLLVSRYRQCGNGGARAAAATWAIVVLAPPLFIYSGRFWAEVPAALLVAIALGALARASAAAAPRRADLVLLVAALATLPLLKLRFLALALPLLGLAILRLGGRLRTWRLALAGVWLIPLAGLAGLLAWNSYRFGNPLRMYAAGELAPTASSFGALGRGAVGLGFDVAYGLFAAAPIWLLLVPALVAGATLRRAPIPELLAALPYLCLVAGRREWYAGWSPPFRYGVVLLPVLALALAPLFTRRAGLALRGLLALLAAATAALALVALLHPAWTFSLADGGSRPSAELSALYSGDLVRFTPSAVRPRLATALWLLAVPLAAAAALIRDRSPNPARRVAISALLAPSCLIFGFAVWLVAATSVATRVVEVEDSWVDKHGGSLFPGVWTIDRTRYPGGWSLGAGQSLSFEPVPAGGAVGSATLRLRASRVDPERDGAAPEPSTLDLLVGDRRIASFPSPAPPASLEEAAAWTTFVTDSLSIAAGDRIELEHPASSAPALWVIDRVELDWR